MAQTNYTPISLYYSTTASAVPTAANLVPGELAINTNDGKLYYEDSSGVVRVLASKSTGTVGGSTTQVQFNSSGSLGGSAAFVWDGSNIVVNSTTPAYFTGTSNLAQIAINRSPSTGTIFNASQSAAFINIDGVSGGSSIQFATATANNTQPSEAMRITSAGNVGIGTSSPTNKLQVTGGGLTVNGTSPAFTANAAIIDVSGSITRISAAGPDNTTNGTMAFNTASANAGVFNERMRITSAGELLVGTTSSVDSGILQVAYASGVNNGIIFRTNGTGSQYAAIFYNGNGAVGSITTNASATAYNTSSDYRLKENITSITGALATVAQLKPVTYKWKTDGSDGQGFIAHELAEVVPDCVTGEKDAVDENGKPKYQGVDTSFLVATLVSAIQEQQALIESLTTRLTALENK